MKLIVATDENNGIGLNGRLPWHIPEETKLFRDITMGQTLIMGSKTFENTPPLDGRVVIVVSHDKDKGIPLQEFTKTPNRYFVAGGKEIYTQLFKYCDELHISTIHHSYKCDTYISFDLENFKLVEEIEYKEFTYRRYIRKDKI